jgi:hypothetical protein
MSKALRIETDAHQSRHRKALLTQDPLPDNFKRIGDGMFLIDLPASVYMTVQTKDGHIREWTYHSAGDRTEDFNTLELL